MPGSTRSRTPASGWVAAERRYVASTHFWGDDYTPRLRDLNGDGRPEFVSFDDRFAYAFGSFAESSFPIRIWRYRQGRFLDVTRRFTRRIRADAAVQWRFYLRYRKNEPVRGLLAAWAADEELLGRDAVVWPALERARRAGYLHRYCDAQAPCDETYVEALRRFLRKLGYLRG